MFVTLIPLVLTLLSYSTAAQAEPRAVYATAGLGIEGIAVGYSTKKSVFSKFGDDFSLIEHEKYSYEMRYNTGMSFWYRYDDHEQKIFSIQLRPESHAFTSRGIVVGRSTLQDVFDAYGKSGFFTTSAEESWFFDYPGIQFHVEFKANDWRLNSREKKLLKRKVIAIQIESESAQIQKTAEP